MRHAYYLAKSGRLYGDEEYGRDLESIYKSFITCEPGHYDGVSRYDLTDGTVRVRLTLRNLFVDGPPFVGDLT